MTLKLWFAFRGAPLFIVTYEGVDAYPFALYVRGARGMVHLQKDSAPVPDLSPPDAPCLIAGGLCSRDSTTHLNRRYQ
jgi:hypothetical protein